MSTSARAYPADLARPARIGIVGPFVDRHAGWVRTPGQTIADFLRETGWEVLTVSHALGRWRRLFDIGVTLLSRGSRLDVILVMTYGGPSFVIEEVATAIGRFRRRPLVLHLHGGDLPVFFRRFPRWSERVLRRAARLVVPSPYLARALEQLGFSAEVIPNAVDIAAYPFRHRTTVRPHLLWVRTFHPIYDPQTALEALRLLRTTHPDATLVMAGQEKGEGDALHRRAAELGLAAAVRFPGFLEAEDKAREGAAADIFLNTSVVDNQPVTVIEACALGLPVVSTNVGGMPDLLRDGETGLLVPPRDPEAVASAVRRLLEEPGVAGRLSANGRRLAESFDVRGVRDRWEQLLREMVAEGNGGPG